MNHRQETGSALVMAIFVLALISGMGIALLSLSSHEVKMSQADMRSKQVFYLAEAGMEAGRATLLILNGSGSFSDDLTTYAGPDGVLDFDADALQATYDTDGNVTGLTGYGDDVPLINPTAFGGGWYAAFLTNDTVNGTSPNDNNNRVVM
ncbi:MAG: pilus assembly PilX N-terminal domain-containing protein, partial [Acidobacteria bacterium]|nr:pilus assembly PilX N-terminal domain-containing protein [Acidobacteriota bacterium]